MGIQRLLSPIGKPDIAIEFSISCNDSKYKEVCSAMYSQTCDDPKYKKECEAFDVAHPPVDSDELPSLWEKWPQGSKVRTPIDLDFFRDPEDARKYISDRIPGDLHILLMPTNYGASKRKSLSLQSEEDQAHILLSAWPDQLSDVASNNKITSIVDFPGVTMFIATTTHMQELTPQGGVAATEMSVGQATTKRIELTPQSGVEATEMSVGQEELRVTAFSLMFKDGQRIDADARKFEKIELSDGTGAFRYVFGK
jgi:hypothetical protein